MKLKKKKKYKIDIVGVDTLSDAVNYLNKLKVKKKQDYKYYNPFFML